MLTIASIVIFFRKKKEDDWKTYKEYQLTEASYTIGRSDKCDIVLPFPFISRFHCVLILHDELNDYMIRDGSLSETTLANPNPVITPSSGGTYIKGKKLELSKKYPLQNNDEVYLTQSLKILYLRPQNKVIDSFEDTITSPVEGFINED